MKYIEENLLELVKDFIEFADKLYKDKKIDRETYLYITKTKKEFIEDI